jgi:hypothetical protein
LIKEKMYDNYNYPAGADNEMAPWNEPSIPEKDFNITCSQSLSKTVTVTTNNYIPGASGVDYEPDGEGGCSAVGWHDPDDTSDTNWADEYHDNDHYTPLQLIELFKKHLENELNRMAEVKNEKWIKHLIEECSDWIEDDTEYVEDN